MHVCAAAPDLLPSADPRHPFHTHPAPSQPNQKLEVDYTGDSDRTSSGSSSSNVLVVTQSVAARGGLQAHELVVRASGAGGGGGGGGAVADVAVSGLPGWVAVWAPRAKTDVRCVMGAEHGGRGRGRCREGLKPAPLGGRTIGKRLPLRCSSTQKAQIAIVCVRTRLPDFHTLPCPPRLRVWAPRGVEVMLRTPLPLPPPPALLRAWRGDAPAAGAGAAADDETPAALDEWAGALARKWGAVHTPSSTLVWKVSIVNSAVVGHAIGTLD